MKKHLAAASFTWSSRLNHSTTSLYSTHSYTMKKSITANDAFCMTMHKERLMGSHKCTFLATHNRDQHQRARFNLLSQGHWLTDLLKAHSSLHSLREESALLGNIVSLSFSSYGMSLSAKKVQLDEINVGRFQCKCQSLFWKERRVLFFWCIKNWLTGAVAGWIY